MNNIIQNSAGRLFPQSKDVSMIIPYEHKKHFSLLKEWNDARGQVGLEEWMLPDLGYVYDDKAIAFLVTTNSPVAWIAHWTVKPFLSREDREISFNALSGHLEKDAQKMGFKLIQTLARVHRHLLKDLESRGFLSDHESYKFLVKDLRGELCHRVD